MHIYSQNHRQPQSKHLILLERSEELFFILNLNYASVSGGDLSQRKLPQKYMYSSSYIVGTETAKTNIMAFFALDSVYSDFKHFRQARSTPGSSLRIIKSNIDQRQKYHW